MKFQADYLKDEGFKSLVKEEIHKEILEKCKNTKFNNDITIDDLLYNNIEEQNLDIETLYDLIENTYFKVSKNRQRNKIASQNKILNHLNRRYFKLLNEKKQNTDEIRKVSAHISSILFERTRYTKYENLKKELENNESPDKEMYKLMKDNKQSNKVNILVDNGVELNDEKEINISIHRNFINKYKKMTIQM